MAATRTGVILGSHISSDSPTYFEATINCQDSEGSIIIGFVNDSIKPSFTRSGSYGYSTKHFVVYAYGKKKSYGRNQQVKEGEMIGCGIDSNGHLYFTRQGHSMGIVCTVKKGEEIYPAVATYGGLKADVVFAMKPPPYDISIVTSLMCERPSPEGPHIYDLPFNLLTQICSYLSPPTSIHICQLISKYFAKISTSDMVWRELCLNEWPLILNPHTIKHWLEFYKRRKPLLLNSTTPKIVIEACYEPRFPCPVSIDTMKTGLMSYLLYCHRCKEEVHLVTDIEELHQRAARQECVAVDYNFR
eukprot:TRINITY_DN6504_c0_g1_i1.p1 TRINITY_DN6504_c0_g1~~TRINITY_DN6504_c0_g1_i1.p1  ORF type:complete len:302 (+),score=25.13 TRINITY_DN6504_c0_g1_i1:1-906(+)